MKSPWILSKDYLKYAERGRCCMFLDWFYCLFLNAFLSPFIYVAFLDDFKKAAKRIVCRTVNRLNRGNSVEIQQCQENITHWFAFADNHIIEVILNAFISSCWRSNHLWKNIFNTRRSEYLYLGPHVISASILTHKERNLRVLVKKYI